MIGLIDRILERIMMMIMIIIFQFGVGYMVDARNKINVL
jgi:hypothetical protein